MTATMPDLTGHTDVQLAALCAGADEDVITAVIAEGERRDREAQRKERADAAAADARAKYTAKREALKSDYWAWVHAEFLGCEARCCGNWFSAEGRKHTHEPMSLWQRPESVARRWASWEVNAWWDEPGHAHMTFTQYMRQRAMSARVDRDAREGERMDAETATPAPAAETGRTWEGSQHYRDRAAQRRDRADAGRAQIAVRQSAAVATQAPQISGAVLLSYVRAFVTKFTYLSPAQADAVTLWIGHSHARDEDGFLSWAASPRLYALSSRPGSGKSTLLEHLGRLCPATFGLDTEPTEAGLVYTISKEHATVLLDEGDVLFASGRRKSAVRAVINSGYTPNGTTLKIKNGKGERVRIYGALALAALDVVEKATGGTMEATLSRGVKLIMVQAPEGYEIPEMTRTDEMNAAKLKMVLEKYGPANRDEMAAMPVDVPDGIRNRQAQIWKTLLRVGAFADLSHKRAVNDPDAVPPGGSWYDRAWDACEALALAGADDDADRTAEMMDELGDAFGALDGED